ncbi:hypothetical protein MRX96_047039 [Rhipicephalus microplus]
MTSSGGGDDWAGHAAGGRRRAKQMNDLLTLIDCRPVSGGRQGQPGRPRPSRSACPHVQGPGTGSATGQQQQQVPLPKGQAQPGTSPSRGGQVPGRERFSTVGQRIKVGNAASIPPSLRQHDSPHSDADHDSPRRSQPPSPERALPPLPPFLGSIAGSSSQNSRDVTTPSATSDEESSPEGSRCYSLIQQDPDAAPATPRTSEQGEPQHSMAMAQADRPLTKSFSHDNHRQRRHPHTTNII